MSKTTKYVLIGLGALAVLYLIAAKSSPIKLGSSSGTTNSGVAGILVAGSTVIDSIGGLIGDITGGGDEEE